MIIIIILLNLSNFSTSNVTDMSWMFSNINKACNLISKDEKY